MQNIILPPPSFLKDMKNDGTHYIFKKIMQNYKDEEVVFKLIKNNGRIKLLRKKECLTLSQKLSKQIISSLKIKDKTKQIKIFAVIGASEESIIMMLSSLLIGAHHCICFEDLSENAILQRLEIFKPDIILFRQNLKEKINNISRKININLLPTLEINLKMYDCSIDNSEIINSTPYNYDSSLFTLFTSGSTGVPKAVVHGIKEYLDYAKFSTQYFFGVKKGITIFTATDAGWINGHTYAFYGPLLLGAVSVVNEQPLFISLPSQLGNILDKVKPDIFYTSVTVLRLLMSAVTPKQSILDFCSDEIHIERIGSCGEPLANSVGKWAIEFFRTKRKSIVNTYFQTETGGVLVAPRDEDIAPEDYSSVGKPRKELGLAIAGELMSKIELSQEKLDPNEILICKKWDGIFKKIISDKDSNYFTKSGYFRLHDVGYLDHKGYLFIGGRSDDVINVAGHRISSSEIENISLTLEEVNEACAIAIPDEICGSKVELYFATTISNNDLISKLIPKLKKLIKANLSQYHMPKNIYYFNNLPKTKSGKIMRRLMRSLSEDSLFDESADYSTLANKDKFLDSAEYFLKKNKKYS